MILDLHRQGLSLSSIARRTGLDRKTIRRYVERGLEPPAYQPRPPRANKVAPFQAYLRKRVATYPARLPLAQLDFVYSRGLKPVGLEVPKGRIWWRMSDHLPLIAEFKL